jgi:hypothetical protein
MIVIVIVCTAALAAAEPPQNEPTRLTVHPAAAPSPALKYQLLPEAKDEVPGNAVQLYYRAFSPEWMNWYFRDGNGEKVYNLAHMPFAEFAKTSEAKERWLSNSNQLREIDRAARCSYCDWELTDRLKADGIGLLLPDIQSMRSFANLLALRARMEMLDRDNDKVVRTFQTGLGMSRHVADAPLLINALVGIATSQVALDQVEEFIQQPGSPNLYWALTYLPSPLIDLRRAIQGERLFLDSMFPETTDIEKRVLTVEQAQALLEKQADTLQKVQDAGPGIDSMEKKLLLTGLTIKAYPAAKQFLLSQGRKSEDVEKMPAYQAVLIYSRYQYFRHFDEAMRWQGFPFWQAKPGLDRADAELRASAARMDTIPFARLLLPAMEKVFMAQARLDRRIAALRCIEAIRLYAAAHDGKLPASLSDIKEAPIPMDPIFGKEFEYAVNGDKATLRAPPPWKGADQYAMNYELTLQR